MSNDIKVGDMVEHVFKIDKFTNKPVRYKVLEMKEEPGVLDKMSDLFNDQGFKNIRCLSQNNERGWLSSEEVKKVKNDN